jgi:DNA-binding MarR family transcriptional regulator
MPGRKVTLIVLDSPVTYQVGLSFYYRGPDWAIAVRQGDLESLEWVLERCSQFWNGAGTLIIPVRSDGRTWPIINDYLETRPVETCFVHESVPETARHRLVKSLGSSLVRHWSSMWDGFDENEMHPLRLQPLPPDRLRSPSLLIPRFDSARLRRIALATWGNISSEDLADYRNYFTVGDVGDQRTAIAAMLSGQVNGVSPAEQSLALLGTYGSLPIGRSLFVFDRGSFQELVAFWNLRGRLRDVGNRPMVFGVPLESLKDPETLTALSQFITRDNLYAQEPDLGLMVGQNRKLAQVALEALGFRADRGKTVRRSIGGGRGDRPLSFGFFGPVQEGPVKKGVIIHDQVTVTHREVSFRPPRPDTLPQTGHYIRMGIEGLPLPMPLTDSGANAVLRNAFRSPEGLTIKTDAWIGQGYVRLTVPDAWDALVQWASARGESVALSPPGRYGQALLDRLGGLQNIDALASAQALAVLSALTPLSRRKLAQRVVAEATRQAGVSLDEKLLTELLGKNADFLELRARSATEIAGEATMPRKQILPALRSLVDAGFVVRGASVRCPRCRIAAVLSLSEQSERIRCRACKEEYLLPVLEEGGQIERPTVYLLDGLMARAMDQDLLPVLLTLRACLPADISTVRAVWLGLEFDSSDGSVEHDLLISDGNTVWVAECKASAGISRGQLDSLLEFADRHEARPVLGALEGSFLASQKRAIVERGGSVFERQQLLTDP